MLSLILTFTHLSNHQDIRRARVFVVVQWHNKHNEIPHG